MRIIFIDDDHTLRETARHYMQNRRPNDVFTCVESAEEARAYLANHTVDAVITDISMPGEDGISLALWIREILPHVPIHMISGNTLDPLTRTNLNNSSISFSQKPLNFASLIEEIEKNI